MSLGWVRKSLTATGRSHSRIFAEKRAKKIFLKNPRSPEWRYVASVVIGEVTLGPGSVASLPRGWSDRADTRIN